MSIIHLKKHLSIAVSALLFTSILAADETKNSKTEELDSVTIVEQTNSDYQPTGKIETNRTNIELEDSAKSVQVYNEDFLYDYQPQSLTDVVTMSSNVTYGGDSHGRTNNYIMRGFSNTPILRDGFNITNAITNTEMYNLEKIEVLKGPDSLQYGESSPGGIINLVKKKPKKEQHAQIEIETTTDPSFKPKIDVGGSINEDGSLRYRLVSTYTHKEHPNDFNVDTKKIFVAPTVAYDINDNHTITFMTEYLDETTPADFGTFVGDDGEPLTDRDTVTTHPDAEYTKVQKIIGLDLDSSFDTWDSNFRYRYVDLKRDNDSVYSPYVSGNIIRRNFSTQNFASDEHAAQYTINKEFNLASLKNRLSLGVDAKRAHSTNSGYYDVTVNYDLDPTSVSYDALTYLSDHPNAYSYVDNETTMKTYGGFVQDHINLTEELILSLGLRYQKVKTESTNNLTTTTKNYNKTATTPQIGLVYKVTPQTTLYTNYSESFNPQDAKYIDVNGDLLDPEEGKGYELGIKQKLFSDKFTLTTALFDIEKTNVAMQDPAATRANMFYTTSQKVKSKGFEMDLVGQITDNLSLIASYGYTKTEDTENDNNQLAGVAKHTANIFTTYDLTSFGLSNMYIGGGARFIGSRYADADNDIKIDSDIIYNATFGYKKGNWKANLSIKNLTDEKYIETASTSNAAYGDRRTAMLTVSYSF